MLWAQPDAPQDRSRPQAALDKCIAESRDADQHAGNLSNWLQEYDQLGEGEFYGRVEELTFDRLQVFSEHTSKALRQQCNVWPNAIWLGIPVDEQGCRINGLPVSDTTIMCRPGNRDFELVTPETFDILGIVVDRDLLHRAADIQGVALPESRLEQSRLTLPADTLADLRFVLKRLIGSAMPLAAKKHSQDLVMMALLQVLQGEGPAPERIPSYAHRKAVVDRIKGYMAAHGDAPVTMTELCELAHVSRRTLQYSFETILGISPLRFLRVTRLNQARRALAEAGSGRTVTEISAEFGFWHAGQFAKDYKQLFAESPSETLRRSQRLN
ncbi:helix-turn-helix domain-containing protein [Halopseudomonas pelagia]|uniref:AraC family transcriptional regulator n=1 Tax=Halopseudomonas pelagia TaxID=553151 RepID=A0AA91Z8E7_9GAMM|nr:helix-turn-helix domain-containing protein [Halopseudomonas pelagia]PCD01176.1 AraC family transcriptional regulator [Halopseudomonas pelagia]QFY57082.1 helix-turn-helix domain-containing protein [Halopseudomonas pelagia]